MRQIIMNPAPRARPLDILVENFYCDEDPLTRALAAAGCRPDIGRILDAFPPLSKRTPPDVRILNIDNRIYKGYVCAINTLGQTAVEVEKLTSYLPEIKRKLGSDSLVSFLDRTRNDMCSYHIEGVDRVLIPEFDELRNIHKTRIESFSTKTIVGLQGKELQKLAMYIFNDEVAINLLSYSMDANTVNHIARAQGDVALFAGAYHGILVEECLRMMGYRQDSIVSPQRHEFLKFYNLYLGYRRRHRHSYNDRSACKEALSRKISSDQGRELSPAQFKLLDDIMTKGKCMAQDEYPQDPTPEELFHWLR